MKVIFSIILVILLASCSTTKEVSYEESSLRKEFADSILDGFFDNDSTNSDYIKAKSDLFK